MSRLLSCYCFSKNTFLQSKCLFFRKSDSPLDLLFFLTADLACSEEGCRGLAHSSLEFLDLHKNRFVYGCIWNHLCFPDLSHYSHYIQMISSLSCCNTEMPLVTYLFFQISYLVSV